ncbi:DUF3037 domain-containing protein [Kineosporia sp. NBRC 101731]|uniref:DUF3037 domain-containing protein n=1 Tax=Kineosporia sp. NBRC 101731 TaxID=3032199 RepID=UPI0024A238CC|nr:DUF3037 domain-containing protein [Kineosporia sp. NBRC 101731]GLY31144.1 hypothetical protein Kisp02_45090 [Kineosporia sp. NBRC 101731]
MSSRGGLDSGLNSSPAVANVDSDPDGPKLFTWAVVRAVPRMERGEFVNIGVVLYSQHHEFLACTQHLSPGRLQALDPDVDLAMAEAALRAIGSVCEGSPAAGLIGEQPRRARFGWLTAPKSTVVHTGPVHSGLTSDPEAELAGLHRRLVLHDRQPW